MTSATHWLDGRRPSWSYSGSLQFERSFMVLLPSADHGMWGTYRPDCALSERRSAMTAAIPSTAAVCTASTPSSAILRRRSQNLSLISALRAISLRMMALTAGWTSSLPVAEGAGDHLESTPQQ